MCKFIDFSRHEKIFFVKNAVVLLTLLLIIINVHTKSAAHNTQTADYKLFIYLCARFVILLHFYYFDIMYIKH